MVEIHTNTYYNQSQSKAFFNKFHTYGNGTVHMTFHKGCNTSLSVMINSTYFGKTVEKMWYLKSGEINHIKLNIPYSAYHYIIVKPKENICPNRSYGHLYVTNNVTFGDTQRFLDKQCKYYPCVKSKGLIYNAKGWIQLDEQLRRNRPEARISWTDAERMCNRSGLHLPYVDSKEKAEELVEEMMQRDPQGQGLYIGLKTQVR